MIKVVDTGPGHFDLDPEGMFSADVALHLTDPNELFDYAGDTVAMLELEVTNVEDNEKLLAPVWVGIELTLDDLVNLSAETTRLLLAVVECGRDAAK